MVKESERTPGVGPNTQRVLDIVTGKNAAFVKRVAKQQLEKYGNDDIFSITVKTYDIEVDIGENWKLLSFQDGTDTIVDERGLVGGGNYDYAQAMRDIAIEARHAWLAKNPKLATTRMTVGYDGKTRDILIHENESKARIVESVTDALIGLKGDADIDPAKATVQGFGLDVAAEAAAHLQKLREAAR